MYMFVKFLLENLNSNSYISHLTSTYTRGVTITPMVCNDI